MSKKGNNSSNKNGNLYPFHVLSEEKLSYKLADKYKQYPEEGHRQLLARNKKALDFLEITRSEREVSAGELYVRTSRYAGCVPIVEPEKGLHLGNISVGGRFGEDISELLSIIGDFVPIEFNKELELQGNFVKPPLYFECQHFIDQYLVAKRYRWRKFDNIQRIERQPTASTQWDKYALRSFDPGNTLKYLNKSNVLTCDHPEWNQLNYVLHIAIKEILSTSTPNRSRQAYRGKIALLENSYDKLRMKQVDQVRMHMSDPVVIKELKTTANNILQNQSSKSYAWRIDYAEFFERYVQFIIKKVAQSKGARFHVNPKYGISGNKPTWALRYLEPDIIVEANDYQYIIDAKYKAHLYNTDSSTDELKDTFRADLHQVLAYTAFSGSRKKCAIIAYPAGKFMKRDMNVNNPLNGYSCKVTLIGIPLRKSDFDDVITKLSEIIKFDKEEKTT